VKKNSDEVVVLGLGFVGLTLSVFLAKNKKRVLGIETDSTVRDKLRSKKAHFYERDLDSSLRDVLKSENFIIFEKIPPRTKEQNRIYIITVGTPFLEGEISSSALEKALIEIFSDVENGDCIVTRSTVGIGMATKFIVNPLTKMAKDVDVVVAPERTVEGVALQELGSLPQLVGGSPRASMRMREFFSEVGVATVELGSLEAAEFAKLMSNSFRDLIFGVSNEYAMFANHLGLDFNTILEQSKAGYQRLSSLMKPGPVAGPCLSKDPKIFSRSGELVGFQMKITGAARDQNEHLASHVIDNILNYSKVSKIGILGLAFKGEPETNDTRDSFVNLLLEQLDLKDYSGEIQLWDPLGSELHSQFIKSAKYSELDFIVDECDVVVLQNSNLYFSSKDFINRLEKRKSNRKKLLVYQLWNCLPDEVNDTYQVVSLSNFRYLQNRKKLP
jgi:UDP-N-acetyl-D-mannosaminuronic acid dehydrogenase